MTNLMLHCGARHVERQQVEASPTPAASETWQPIPHLRLLELVETTLTSGGLIIKNEAHALWQDGDRYFGLLEVANGVTHADYALIVALRNSHDKSFPAAIAMGSQVVCCDNLAFFGEIRIARRHTRYIERDLPRVVSTAVARLTDVRDKQDERIETYKNTAVDDRTAHDLIVRAIDASVLPVTQLPAVLSEWRKPRFKEFEEQGHTAWRLFNSFTVCWKGGNLALLPKRSQSIH